MKKTFLVAIAILLLYALYVMTHEYKEPVSESLTDEDKQTLIQGCEAGGMTSTQCSCIANYVSHKLTKQQIILEIKPQVDRGEMPVAILKAIELCKGGGETI